MFSLLNYFSFFINKASALSAFIKAMTMRTITKENGKAAIIMVFCKAVNPFTESKMTAIVD